MSEIEAEIKDPIDGDRGIPSVSQNRDNSKIIMAVFLVFACVAIIIVVLQGMEESKPQKLTQSNEETFKTYGANSAPYIEENDEPPLNQLNAATQSPAPVAQQVSAYEQWLQQEAIRIAKEKQAEHARRIASPQIVYDEKVATVAPNQGNSMNGAAPSGSNDPNMAFANQYQNSGSETAHASQLQNLDALITQGTLIDGILETAIQSDLPGMVRAIVSENIYSFEGSNLMIPKGSKLIGRYNSGLVRGQSRVFVIWNRLIRPDGVSINIGSFGADSLGRSGLGGEIDTHFFERFGSSVLLSLINASIEVGANAVDNQEAANIAIDSGDDFSKSAEMALENSIAIKPTVNVHQGTQIKVFVGKDLDFSQVSDKGF